MKMIKLLLCTILFIPTISIADHILVIQHMGSKANPDRVRVAGSALILKADKMITDESIPSNVINPIEAKLPENAIIEGTLDDTESSIDKRFIVQPN